MNGIAAPASTAPAPVAGATTTNPSNQDATDGAFAAALARAGEYATASSGDGNADDTAIEVADPTAALGVTTSALLGATGSGTDVDATAPVDAPIAEPPRELSVAELELGAAITADVPAQADVVEPESAVEVPMYQPISSDPRSTASSVVATRSEPSHDNAFADELAASSEAPTETATEPVVATNERAELPAEPVALAEPILPTATPATELSVQRDVQRDVHGIDETSEDLDAPEGTDVPRVPARADAAAPAHAGAPVPTDASSIAVAASRPSPRETTGIAAYRRAYTAAREVATTAASSTVLAAAPARLGAMPSATSEYGRSSDAAPVPRTDAAQASRTDIAPMPRTDTAPMPRSEHTTPIASASQPHARAATDAPDEPRTAPAPVIAEPSSMPSVEASLGIESVPVSAEPSAPTEPAAPTRSIASPAPTTPSTAAPTPHAPVTLERIEDLATAIERMRPIPRGGAVIEVQAPGLGAMRVEVTLEDGTVRVRIDSDDPRTAAWIEGEQRGLTAAARQAAPEASSVELDLRHGHGDGRERPSQRASTGEREAPRSPGAPTSTPAAQPERPIASARRGLVDVLA